MQKLKLLVVDSGPIINGSLNFEQAETFVTISEVMNEIRDKRSSELLSSLPFQIQVLSPTKESLDQVIEFSKKTGDFSVLSITDLKIIALTLTLTKKENGDAHVRKEPVKAKAQVGKDKDREKVHKFTVDDQGWITPKNVQKVKEESMKGAMDKKEESFITVGCFTSDFAMQNVLMQMNLKLISEDGKVVKQLKNWVLRCHACYEITSDMEKRFCPRCGYNTLMRTSYSVDEAGNVKYYLKRNMQYNLRGTKYGIPKPKGGHNSKDLIFAEDQKEYIHAMKKQSKKVSSENLSDVNYVPSLYQTASCRERQIQLQQLVTIGYGKRNVNQTGLKKKELLETITDEEEIELAGIDKLLEELEQQRKCYKEFVKLTSKEPPETKSFFEADSEFIRVVTDVNTEYRKWDTYEIDENVHPGSDFKKAFERVGKAFHQQNEAGRRVFLNLFLSDIILRPEFHETLRIFPELELTVVENNGLKKRKLSGRTDYTVGFAKGKYMFDNTPPRNVHLVAMEAKTSIGEEDLWQCVTQAACLYKTHVDAGKVHKSAWGIISNAKVWRFIFIDEKGLLWQTDEFILDLRNYTDSKVFQVYRMVYYIVKRCHEACTLLPSSSLHR